MDWVIDDANQGDPIPKKRDAHAPLGYTTRVVDGAIQWVDVPDARGVSRNPTPFFGFDAVVRERLREAAHQHRLAGYVRCRDDVARAFLAALEPATTKVRQQDSAGTVG